MPSAPASEVDAARFAHEPQCQRRR